MIIFFQLCELAYVLLSGDFENCQLIPPGAAHEARFMATALFTEKMVLLKDIYPSQKDKKKIGKLEKFVTFTAIFYVPYHLRSALTICAPRIDIEFLDSLRQLQLADSSYSHMCEAVIESIEKMHNFFLSEELIVLALCDPLVDSSQKGEIAAKILDGGQAHAIDNVKLKPTFNRNVAKESLSDCVGPNSTLFFQLLDLDRDFLREEPSQWPNNESFQKFETHCKALQCVNDTAERNVQLAQTCILQAREENKLQHIFKIKKNVQRQLPRRSLTKELLNEYLKKPENCFQS